MENNSAIVIFDSGLGGLSVWREIRVLLPHENLIYLADSANCPYGPKKETEIKARAFACAEFLLSKGCKTIVVACNTATAAAIDDLRRRFNVPFIGMEPAVKPAALNSKTGHVGILATQGTFNGRLFKETSQKFASNVELHVQVGHGLVELVEKGETNTERAASLLREYIGPMLDKNIDYLVLGCTHYPFLSEAIEKITLGRVHLIDPAPAVARRLKEIFNQNSIGFSSDLTPEFQFYSNGDKKLMQEFLQNFLKVKAEVFSWG